MTVPTDRRAARGLVEQISDDYGYFNEEELREINPGTRRKIERFRTKANEDRGSNVITLAKNLYTSKARFIFELLQNADDNNYKIAAKSGSLPSVSFHVHPRRIVIDCNEDGFTGDNLKAICSVGKSSKTGAQGYIGEKGIGFKSVFMVAWKVHIQSGPFSFSFTHRPGDSGIGMITPIWEGNQEELVQPLTRDYFESSPVQPIYQGLTWMEWFYVNLMVESYVYFTPDNSASWTGAAEYLRTERPEKFLGALRVHYQHNRYRESTDDFIQSVQHTDVLCRGNHRVSLRGAYFPTQILEKLVGQYVEPGAFFPWLWLDTKDTYEYVPSDWKEMLTEYGVGLAEGVDFALHMLQYSLDALQVPADGDISPSSRTRLFALYDHIQSTYRAAEDRNAARHKIRNAPQIMKTKSVLRLLYASCGSLAKGDLVYLETFFAETLGIGNCTWELYVEELNTLRRTGCKDIKIITVIYQELRTLGSKVMAAEEQKLRDAFENEALICVPSHDGQSWHKASQCVWSIAASLRGKVSLNSEYEGFEDFFVNFIGVKPVDLRMAIEELKKVGSHSGPQAVSIQDVKDTVMTVNSLLANETRPPPPGKILDHRIFPIRQPSGTIECGTGVDDFFIVDREPLRRSFEGSVKFLDFTLDEVVELGPFITWTGLETRYISSCVKEYTSFGGSGERALSHPNREIRHKAHALLRVAYHFNSPRTTSPQGRMALYDILRNARIYETNRVTSQLRLAQGGFPHVVEGETTGLHFHEDGTNLDIYVPADEDDQDYTFAKALPERLFEWLMSHPDSNITAEKSERGVAAAKAILLTPVSRVKRALEDCGIKTIQDVVDYDEAARQELTSSVSVTTVTRASNDGTETTISGNGQSRGNLASGDFVTPVSSIETSQRPSTWNSGRNSRSGSPLPLRKSSDLLMPLYESTIPIRSAHDTMYVALLSKVMAAGRSLGCSISNRVETTMDHQPLIDSGVNHEVHSVSSHERNFKIGAAGELYIFELLSHLNLPGFSEGNWQSRIRKYVSVHPKYAELKPWTRQETADITYTDINGKLTEIFINGGYLDRETWSEKTPKYFIEVKTTLLSCDEPFYMSTAQYSRPNSLRIMAARLLTATLLASGVTHATGEVSPLNQGFGPSIEAAKSRGPAIFNAVNDAMRQWGSSLHHNGMSFYLATVPEGVILHHGNNDQNSPDDPDWLAYEIEHAEIFARGRHGGPPGRGPPGGGPPPPGDDPGRPPFNKRNTAAFDLIKIAKDDNPQQAIFEDPIAEPQDLGSMQGEGGWLHTYRTARPLRYLYIDGMGGGKTSMGTMGKRSGGPMDEKLRAAELCEMCGQWNLSGVIRMEAGFEIIQCDFFDGLEEIQVLQRPDPSERGGGPGGPGLNGQVRNFEYIRGLSERYFGIGSSRTIIDYSSMVSAFFYPVNLTNPDPKRPDLPRLSNVSEAELDAMKSYLKQVIRARHDEGTRTIDWQDVTDIIVGRYADRIQSMVEKSYSPDSMLNEIDFLLTVYIDHSGKDKDQISAATARCANFYLHSIRPITDADHLIHAGIKAVTTNLCTKLFDVRGLLIADGSSSQSDSQTSAVATLRSLMEYLGWARFKRCPPCDIDEVCLIPMWPFGTKKDYESPRCVNSSSSGGDWEDSYWGGPGGPGGPPGGGRRPPDDGRDGKGPH
ncbi:hypothetical protein VMCG_10385 [Cytospora schulzeri]|uniref:Protein NO VEIN C-terminal domain-containing protein n=1 Tax=Cytospora schulzeri TaxID=448051 RepID=A0A423VCM6_9PEZI|nr:hypothetical protein VMCG_10385 [Valsa malicola]